MLSSLQACALGMLLPETPSPSPCAGVTFCGIRPEIKIQYYVLTADKIQRASHGLTARPLRTFASSYEPKRPSLSQGPGTVPADPSGAGFSSLTAPRITGRSPFLPQEPGAAPASLLRSLPPAGPFPVRSGSECSPVARSALSPGCECM